MDKNKKLLLWDADYIAFKHKKDNTLEEAIVNIDDHIKEVLEFSGCDYFSMFLSYGKYFRHELAKTPGSTTSYKANRSISTQPWIRTIKAYLEVKYGATYGQGWEADDSLGYFHISNIYFHKDEGNFNQNNLHFNEVDDDAELIDTILCSCDKDIINGFSGNHLNPDKKTSTNIWQPVWIETSVINASFNVWEAMIIGDSSDGIKGLYRKGKSFTNKLFVGKSLKEAQLAVFNEYLKEYGEQNGIYEFQKSYRQLYILRTNDDFMREIGYVPSFPNIIPVIKENENNVEF